MTFLLDTHAFLWFINDDTRLSPTALNLLESDVDLLFSMASLWEIAIKVSLKKLTLPLPFRSFVEEHLTANEIELLPLQPAHLEQLIELPFYHRDPFDRLIVAQTLAEGLELVSGDMAFDLYGLKRYW